MASLPEVLSEILADEEVEKAEVELDQDIPLEDLNEPENSTDIIEPIYDMPDRPPEEFAEPAETLEEMAEAVLEDPLLAYDLEPEMLADGIAIKQIFG